MLVSQFDCDADGCVELTEWLAALIDWPVAQQHPDWITWAQQVGGGGHMLVWVLLLMYHVLLGHKVCLWCAGVQVFRACDQDGDGVISGPVLLALLQAVQLYCTVQRAVLFTVLNHIPVLYLWHALQVSMACGSGRRWCHIRPRFASAAAGVLYCTVLHQTAKPAIKTMMVLSQGPEL
jgi:hypothetical protein